MCLLQVAGASTSLPLTTASGEHPLHLASARGHLSAVLELMALGADPCAMDSSSRAALDYAARSGHGGLCTVLLQNGGKWSMSSLERAMASGDENTVSCFTDSVDLKRIARESEGGAFLVGLAGSPPRRAWRRVLSAYFRVRARQALRTSSWRRACTLRQMHGFRRLRRRAFKTALLHLCSQPGRGTVQGTLHAWRAYATRSQGAVRRAWAHYFGRMGHSFLRGIARVAAYYARERCVASHADAQLAAAAFSRLRARMAVDHRASRRRALANLWRLAAAFRHLASGRGGPPMEASVLFLALRRLLRRLSTCAVHRNWRRDLLNVAVKARLRREFSRWPECARRRAPPTTLLWPPASRGLRKAFAHVRGYWEARRRHTAARHFSALQTASASLRRWRADLKESVALGHRLARGAADHRRRAFAQLRRRLSDSRPLAIAVLASWVRRWACWVAHNSREFACWTALHTKARAFIRRTTARRVFAHVRVCAGWTIHAEALVRRALSTLRRRGWNVLAEAAARGRGATLLQLEARRAWLCARLATWKISASARAQSTGLALSAEHALATCTWRRFAVRCQQRFFQSQIDTAGLLGLVAKRLRRWDERRCSWKRASELMEQARALQFSTARRALRHMHVCARAARVRDDVDGHVSSNVERRGGLSSHRRRHGVAMNKENAHRPRLPVTSTPSARRQPLGALDASAPTGTSLPRRRGASVEMGRLRKPREHVEEANDERLTYMVPAVLLESAASKG